MSLRRILLVRALCALPALAPARPEPSAEDVGVFVDAIVELQLARNDVAGAVVVVVASGQPLVVHG